MTYQEKDLDMMPMKGSQYLVVIQPAPVQGMNASLDAGMLRGADGLREWKHDIFGCTDDCATCAYPVRRMAMDC
jgi:hypothetical protein